MLLIAPYFPPRPRVGAERPFKFARYLPDEGWLPLIAHLEGNGGDAARPGLSAMHRLALRAPFDRTGRPSRAEVRGDGRRTGLDVGAALDRWVPIDTWWPVLVAQTGRVVRAARRFGVVAVWSTADPWSAHWLGLRVAEALGVPWIADFRDPWMLCGVRGRERPACVRALDARAERLYLQRASAVTFTAPRTTRRYAQAYPAWSERFFTIENAFDSAVSVGSGQERDGLPAAGDARLSLCFFGRFRPLSSAAAIIAALSALNRLAPGAAQSVCVRMAAPLSPEDAALARRAGVEAQFEAFAPVPSFQAIPFLQAHDVLLLSTEAGRDEIIPAKLFDYLAAGQPVLSLCQNPDVADILASTGAGAQAEGAAHAARLLLACIAAKQEGRPLPLGTPGQPGRRDRYSAPHTTRKLAALLDQVTDRASP